MRLTENPGNPVGQEQVMNSVLIDNEYLSAALPDGFGDVPHGELEAFMRFRYNEMWGVRDDERHMLICVTWKDAGKLLSKLVREKPYVKQVDEAFSKRYRNDSYRGNGFFERVVAGADNTAQGLRFAYAPGGVANEGEVLVFKRGVRCYTLCYYTQADVAADNRPVFDDFVASLQVS